jgi:hypothetical protein
VQVIPRETSKTRTHPATACSDGTKPVPRYSLIVKDNSKTTFSLEKKEVSFLYYIFLY